MKLIPWLPFLQVAANKTPGLPFKAAASKYINADSV